MDEFDRRVTEKMERDEFTFEQAAKAVFLEEKKEKDVEKKKRIAAEWVKKLSYRSCRTEFNRLKHLYSM